MRRIRHADRLGHLSALAPALLMQLSASALLLVRNEQSQEVSVIDASARGVGQAMAVPQRPRGIHVRPDGRTGGSLTILDVDRQRIVGSIQLEEGEGKPVGIAVSPDGRLLYTANGRRNSIAIVDAQYRRVGGSVPVGRRPWGVATSVDGRFEYSSNGLSNDASVVDTRTRWVVATIPVGRKPWGIAVSR